MCFLSIPYITAFTKGDLPEINSYMNSNGHRFQTFVPICHAKLTVISIKSDILELYQQNQNKINHIINNHGYSFLLAAIVKRWTTLCLQQHFCLSVPLYSAFIYCHSHRASTDSKQVLAFFADQLYRCSRPRLGQSGHPQSDRCFPVPNNSWLFSQNHFS